MKLPEQIEIRADVMFGKPCLRGTRIPLYLILEKLAAGETTEDLLAAYPQITRAQIMGALDYAAQMAREEVVLAS